MHKSPSALAINGGQPVRSSMLPYGRQTLDEEDIRAVVEVLRSDWLTTGPKVGEFEEALAAWVGAEHAVSFTSGTAALHAAVFAAGLGPGDEAVTTPLTFCATSNCLVYQGAMPLFADVLPDTLNLDPFSAARQITHRTKALLPVDYGGHPADLDDFMELAERHRLIVIEDGCHAMGAQYRGRNVGNICHMTVFSFHPVKHLTTGEGGAVTTNDPALARRLRLFRGHGIDKDARKQQAEGQWFYEMTELGFNYRLSDIACALGLSQLRRLDDNLTRRREIAARYNETFRDLPALILPTVRPETSPAWHLYPIRLELDRLTTGRAEIFHALRGEGLGVNVHYIPVHFHPFYQKRFNLRSGSYPVAEQAYEALISLPIFHGMNDADVEDVIEGVRKVLGHYGK